MAFYFGFIFRLDVPFLILGPLLGAAGANVLPSVAKRFFIDDRSSLVAIALTGFLVLIISYSATVLRATWDATAVLSHDLRATKFFAAGEYILFLAMGILPLFALAGNMASRRTYNLVIENTDGKDGKLDAVFDIPSLCDVVTGPVYVTLAGSAPFVVFEMELPFDRLPGGRWTVIAPGTTIVLNNYYYRVWNLSDFRVLRVPIDSRAGELDSGSPNADIRDVEIHVEWPPAGQWPQLFKDSTISKETAEWFETAIIGPSGKLVNLHAEISGQLSELSAGYLDRWRRLGLTLTRIEADIQSEIIDPIHLSERGVDLIGTSAQSLDNTESKRESMRKEVQSKIEPHIQQREILKEWNDNIIEIFNKLLRDSISVIKHLTDSDRENGRPEVDALLLPIKNSRIGSDLSVLLPGQREIAELREAPKKIEEALTGLVVARREALESDVRTTAANELENIRRVDDHQMGMERLVIEGAFGAGGGRLRKEVADSAAAMTRAVVTKAVQVTQGNQQLGRADILPGRVEGPIENPAAQPRPRETRPKLSSIRASRRMRRTDVTSGEEGQ